MNPEPVLTIAKLAGAREALEFVCKAGADRDVGRRALLLAFVIDPSIVGTQRELARRMGVSEGRASQMLKVLRRGFPLKIFPPVDCR